MAKENLQKFTIRMYPTLSLREEKRLNQFLDVFESNEKIFPMQWGGYETVKLPYDRSELIERVVEGKEYDIFLHRNKAVKYTGYTNIDIDWWSYFAFEFDKSMPKKLWSTFFQMSDQIAEIVQPQFGVTSKNWIGVIPWNTEKQRYHRWMNTCSDPYPKKFSESGPSGVGMRTYFSGDILELLGRDFLKKAPALVTELEWGGIRLDLVENPWEAELEEILEKWISVMKYFESSSLIAIPDFQKDKTLILYSANTGWQEYLERDEEDSTISKKEDVNLETSETKQELTEEEQKVKEVRLKLDQSIMDRQPIRSLNIEGLDLSFTDFSEMEAEFLYASKTNFRAAQLLDCFFEDSYFEEANLDNSNLEGTRFLHCEMSNATLKQAQMREVTFGFGWFNEACFEEADLTKAKLIDPSFTRASFEKALLVEVETDHVSFDEVNFKGAVLEKGNFENTPFTQCDLSEVKASGANFVGAKLSGSILENGDFTNVDFRQATFENVVWKGATIDGAIFDDGVREVVEKQL